MGLLYFIELVILLALGILGTSSVIVEKKPEAKKWIFRFTKYTAAIGSVGFVVGVVQLLEAIVNIKQWLAHFPVYWTSMFATALVEIILGFVFGFGLVVAYLSDKNQVKGEELRQKLVSYKSTLGLVAIGLFLWLITYRIFFFPKEIVGIMN
jgi:flagellar motor component MotA